MLEISQMLCFVSMLLVPCVLAFRVVHFKQDLVLAEDAREPVRPESSSSPSQAELVAKRNRELYLRSLPEG